MGSKKGSETTQTQNVSQSTTVSVQNVIQNTRPLESLEKLKMLADVFTTLDNAETAKKAAGTPGAVVSVANVPAANLFSSPLTLGLVVGGVIFSIYLLRKRRV